MLSAVAIFAYILAGSFLIAKKRLILAGLFTLLIAVTPLLWLLSLPSEEIRAPGTGFFLMLIAIPIVMSLVLLAVGLVIAVSRKIRNARPGAKA